MSTWTRENHEAARARCAMATEGPWAPWLDWVDGVDVNPVAYVYTPEDRAFIAHARADIPALLDEIERLRAESARRMVWLETEQRAHQQTHAALVDMTEHAAHPEITDDMVERAAGVIWAGTHVARTPETLPSATDLRRGGDWYRRNARAALEAALNPGEGQ